MTKMLIILLNWGDNPVPMFKQTTPSEESDQIAAWGFILTQYAEELIHNGRNANYKTMEISPVKWKDSQNACRCLAVLQCGWKNIE